MTTAPVPTRTRACPRPVRGRLPSPTALPSSSTPTYRTHIPFCIVSPEICSADRDRPAFFISSLDHPCLIALANKKGCGRGWSVHEMSDLISALAFRKKSLKAAYGVFVKVRPLFLYSLSFVSRTA